MIRRTLRWVVLPALVLAVVLLAWIVATESGLRRTANFLTGRVPELTIGNVEGRLGGVAVFHDVRWASDGVVVTLRRVELVPRLGSVFTSAYRLQRIEAEGLRVTTSPTDAPDEGELLDLPGFAAEQVRVVDAQWSDGTTTIAFDSISGAAEIGGSQLRVAGLDASGPQNRTRGDIVVDLATLLPSTARLAFDWRVGESAYTGTLDARPQGDLTALALDLKAPFVATANGVTRSSDPWREWQGKLELPSQTIASLPSPWGDAPVALSLEGRGTQERTTLSGSIGTVGRTWILEQATLLRANDVVTFGETRLREGDGPGTVTLSGSLPEDPAQPLAVAATFSDFALPLPDGPAATRLTGTLSVGGTTGMLQLVPDLVVASPNLPAARVTGQAHLTPTLLIASPLELQFGDGALSVVGPIPRDAEARGAVAIVARAFDPAVLASAWPGRLDGAIAFQGTGILAGVPNGTLQVQTLRGELRGHAVEADGVLSLADGRLTTLAFDARSGSARAHAEGRADTDAGVALTLDAPDLAALWPEATGSLKGSAHIPGPLPPGSADGGDAWPLPSHLEATASAVAISGFVAESATLTLDAADGGGHALAFDAKSLRTSGIAFDRVSLRGNGAIESHTLALEGRRGAMTLALAAEGGYVDERWSGTLTSARVEQPQVADAKLRAPVAIELGRGAIEIDQLCLDGVQGNNCVSVHGTPEAGNASAELRSLPIALADAFVAIPDDVTLEGHVDGDGEFRWSADGPAEGRLTLRSARGVWNDPTLAGVDLGYENLAVDATWSGGAMQATLEAALLPAGTLRVKTVPEEVGWRTEIVLAMPRLDWLEEFVPQVDRVTGTVDANLVLRGSLDEPEMEGLVRVGGFASDLPTLGIRVSDGDFVLVRREGGLDVAGTVRSGDGRLALTGRLDRDAKNPVDLRLRGNDVLLVDRGDARVVAAPDLTVILDSKRIVRLGGSVEIPSARIDLSRLEAGAERSADVVVTDAPVTAETRERFDWRAKVKTVVGPDVRLTGFGLDGKVAGTVTVSQRRGRVATGSGELLVDGRYAALGQAFDLERGRLLFSGGPLDNPSLLLIAEQRTGDRTTRVRIVGTARRPELRVSSPQASTESEAIANLMGRSGAFSFGRYLSPKLYVGYGIGLVSGGEIFTVRYRINRSVELEANSGAENNASVNYRIER